MCGIVGAINLSNKEIDRHKLKKMNEILSHRGPDGEGQFFVNNIGLGHTRLSIIDLSEAGHQPMTYFDSGYHITYNGEIYNYIELREELESLGYRFNTATDTEVILASYIQWGVESFHRFNGMWAFAIYNQNTRELILSRDRFGVKPLYYYRDDDFFLFASEKKAILLSEFIEYSIDMKKFNKSIEDPFLFESTGDTEFKNLYNLLPGRYLLMNSLGNINIVKWWELIDNIDQNVPKTFRGRVKKFSQLLEDSCKLRIRADVPRTTSLSGGLDSSSVVRLVSEFDTQKYEAFSHGFEEQMLDEMQYAEIVAKQSDVRLHKVYVDDLIEKEIDNILYSFESIYAGMPDAAYRIYKEQKKAGYKISIDGHGADELLGGYIHYLDKILEDTPLYKPFRLKMIIDTKHNLIRSNEFNWSKFFRYFRHRIGRSMKKRDEMSPKEKQNIYPKHWKSFRKQLYIDFSQTMLPRILKNFEMVSMANSIEVRMPFLDHRLVSYVFGLPDTDLINHGYTKYILRKAMQDKLDDKVNFRKDKIGFNSPIRELLSGKLKKWAQETIEYLDKNSLFDKEAVKMDYQKVVILGEGNWNDSLVLWKKIAAIRLIKMLNEKKDV